MTRLILFLLIVLSCSISYSQTEKASEISEKITQLQQKNNQLVRRINDLESSLIALRNELKASQETVKGEIARGLEIQAQNERAMNLALDGFAEKFEKQNETVKGVQEELSKKFNDQMLMSALGFVALVIIFTIASRSSTQKALKQNVANWNAFQEHLLKK